MKLDKAISLAVKGYLVILGVFFVVKAFSLGFTIDEATTFEVARDLELADWTSEANFHPVNSILVNQIFKISGFHEGLLRIPNVLAGWLFLFLSYKVSCLTSSELRKNLLCILLVSNPFLNDFFSLSRGYGVGLASLLLCLLVLVSTRKDNDYSFQSAFVIGILSGITVFCNYSLIVFVIGILSGYGLCCLQLKKWRELGLLAAVCLCWMIPFLYLTHALQEYGYLYYGGRKSFGKTTIATLLQSYGYGKPWALAPQALLGFIFLLSFGSSTWALSGRIIKNGSLKISHLTSIVFLSAVVVCVSLASLKGTYFLIERTALGFYPVALVAIFFSVPQIRLTTTVRMRWMKSILSAVGGAVAIHSALCFFPMTTYSWFWDLGTKQFVEKLKAEIEESGEDISLGASLYFKPAMMFYLEKEGIEDRVKFVPIDRGPPLFDPNIPQLNSEFYGMSKPPPFCRVGFVERALRVAGCDHYYLFGFYEPYIRDLEKDYLVSAKHNLSRCIEVVPVQIDKTGSLTKSPAF